MESLASVLDEAIDGHTYHAPTRFLALPKDGRMFGKSRLDHDIDPYVTTRLMNHAGPHNQNTG